MRVCELVYLGLAGLVADECGEVGERRQRVDRLPNAVAPKGSECATRRESRHERERGITRRMERRSLSAVSPHDLTRRATR